MHIIAVRLNDDQELDRYLYPKNEPADTVFPYEKYPFVFHVLDFSTFMEDKMPWHWHRDFKMIEVVSGKVNIKSSRSSIDLSEGDLCFINSRVFHSISPSGENASGTRIHVYQCLPEFISGREGNAIDEKYIQPVVSRRDLDLMYLSSANVSANGVKDILSEIRRIYTGNEFGKEFLLRHQTENIFMIIYQNALSRLTQKHSVTDIMEERMQTMVTFIHRNYEKPITMSDVAGSALISERECYRCFKNTLGISPGKYLQHYRVRTAARMLLYSEKSIQEISEACGFTDIGYFGRVFKERMHVTPGRFRKNGLVAAIE